MRRLLFGGAVVTIMAVTAILLGINWAMRPQRLSPYYDEHALERELRQALPVGSSYEQIDEYLTRKQIYHAYSERSNRVNAIIPDVEKRFLITKSITIVIFLDDQRRLESLEVTAMGTGP